MSVLVYVDPETYIEWYDRFDGELVGAVAEYLSAMGEERAS